MGVRGIVWLWRFSDSVWFLFGFFIRDVHQGFNWLKSNRFIHSGLTWMQMYWKLSAGLKRHSTLFHIHTCQHADTHTRVGVIYFLGNALRHWDDWQFVALFGFLSVSFGRIRIFICNFPSQANFFFSTLSSLQSRLGPIADCISSCRAVVTTDRDQIVKQTAVARRSELRFYCCQNTTFVWGLKRAFRTEIDFPFLNDYFVLRFLFASRSLLTKPQRRNRTFL